VPSARASEGQGGGDQGARVRGRGGVQGAPVRGREGGSRREGLVGGRLMQARGLAG